MLSISQISTPPTREEIVTWAIERLSDLGFQTTGWQEGRIQHTILNMFGTVGSAFCQVAAETVLQGYNDTATGAGLSLLSRNKFDNTRSDGVKAAGAMLFTHTGTSPHTVVPGQLLVEDVSTGVQFSNTSGGTIPAGGSLSLDMTAALSGEVGNIDNNSALNLVTSLAGVSVTNPSPGDLNLDGFADPWYTTAGADPESNVTLRQRNATKMSRFSVEKTVTAYENIALEAGAGKVKVIHNNPRGPNTVDVYVATGGAVLGDADMLAIQQAYAAQTFGTEDVWPPTNSPFQSKVEVFRPAVVELDVQGVIYYDPQYTEAQVSASLQQALNDFVALMPVGGRTYTGSGTVPLNDVVQVIEGLPGVQVSTLTAPAGNVPMSATQLLTAPSDWITGKITFVAVTS